MTDSHNVPTDVPTNVPTAGKSGRTARPPRYLSRDGAGWRFQIRIPAPLFRADSFLARPPRILRIRLGILPRKAAEQRAELCAALCRAVFDMAAGTTKETLGMGLENNERDLVEQVMAACQQAIASAIAAPEQALGLARGLETALTTLNLVATECQKGETGNAAIRAGADGMVREALRGVLAHAKDPVRAETALARVPDLLPAVKHAAAAAAAAHSSGSGPPTFGEVSQAYIDMRVGVDGADHPDVKILRMRRQTFLDLMGDRPVDHYTPADLQSYVTAMQYWPANSSIRKVTGGIARGVTDEMAGLDLQVVLAVVRPELTAAECVRKLAAALDRRQTPSGDGVPLLTELPLTDALRGWTDQQLTDLRAVRSGDLDPRKLVFAVLEGPPGCGKTLMAESLAHTVGWAFVPSSVGAWFTVGDGALGGVAKNIKAFVDTVIASEPAIGFLDELDAIPDRASMDNRARDWWTPVINLCLTEIDRLRRSGKRVLLLGATNYYDRLDAALVRPGRMQQRIPVLPPATEAEAEAVFRYYLRNEIPPIEMAKVLRFGIGATPAAVEGWIKEARSLARAEGRSLHANDLLRVMLPADERSPADIRTTALHEIGHAVVAHRLGFPVHQVSILPEGQTGGVTRTGVVTVIPTMGRLRDQVTVMLGGRAADIIFGDGPNTGAEADLAQATSLLWQAEERQGLGKTLVSLPNLGLRHAEVIKVIDAELNRQLERAMAILEEQRAAVTELAQRLIDERVLTGAAVAEKLTSNGSQDGILPASRPATRLGFHSPLDSRPLLDPFPPGQFPRAGVVRELASGQSPHLKRAFRKARLGAGQSPAHGKLWLKRRAQHA